MAFDWGCAMLSPFCVTWMALILPRDRGIVKGLSSAEWMGWRGAAAVTPVSLTPRAGAC